MVSKKSLGILLAVIVIIGAVAGSYFFIYQGNNDPEPESTEVTGYWNGMYHDETIEEFDGNEIHRSNLPMVKDRAIARLEVIRDEPMKNDVELKIRTREEFKEDNPFQFQSMTYADWLDTIWFGQLIVPGQVETADVREDLRGNQTLAYYLIGEDTLVLIVEPDEDGYVKVDEQRLVHELNHAMQDQRIGLDNEKLRSQETTVRQAQLALTEGESQLVENIYTDNCEEMNWSCPTYETETGHRSYDYLGYTTTVLAPYHAGEAYMTEQYQEGGWDAVDKAFTENPPLTMKDIVYPDRDNPDERVVVRDISTSRWNPYNVQGYEGQDSLGVVGISSMLHHYEVKYDINTKTDGATAYNPLTDTRYNYANELSEDLQYDGLLPYRTASGEEGFVWTIIWDNPQAADHFTDVYSSVLLEKGGSQIEDPEYAIQDKFISEHNVYEGPAEFQGYFSIARNEEMVVITYSQEQSGLSELRPTRSEPVTLKDYQTTTYDPPEYSISAANSTESVSSGERDYTKYLNLIVVILLGVIYMMYSARTS